MNPPKCKYCGAEAVMGEYCSKTCQHGQQRLKAMGKRIVIPPPNQADDGVPYYGTQVVERFSDVDWNHTAEESARRLQERVVSESGERGSDELGLAGRTIKVL